MAAILLLVYSSSLDCGWHLDDFHSILHNPNIQLKALASESIARSLYSEPNHPEKLYRPVSGLSFAFNYFVSGTNPFSYHLVNLFIHWLCSVFLFLFLYQTLHLPALREKYSSSAYSIAFLSALLWALNPIQTQSVTYVVQRMTSLCGLFYIMSMFFYGKGRAAPEASKRVLYGCLSFGAFALAFGSKENAVLLPVSILLYEGLLVQTHIGSWARRNKGSLIAALALILGFGLLYIVYRKGGVLSFLSDYEERPFTLGQRLLTQPRVILFYVFLILYPIPSRLSIAHSFDISTSLFSPVTTLPAILCIAGAGVISLLLRKQVSILTFSFFFFLANHLLESSAFPLELVFEHRNYIPSMMIFVPMAIGLCHLLKRYRHAAFMTAVLAAFVGLLLVGLGNATYLRNFAWKTEETLWSDASTKAADHFRPHHNLGVAYEEQGRFQEALREFETALDSKALNRRTEKVVAYYQLGRVFNRLGDLQKAKSLYEKALAIDPRLTPALSGLAVVYEAKGNPGKALDYMERALEADSEDPYVNFNLGLHYLKQGAMDRAQWHFQKAAMDEALRGATHLYLGVISKQKGQLGRASMHFSVAAAAKPKDVTPHLHLLELYHGAGLREKSRREGEILLDMIGRDEALFRQTVDLVLMKGSGHDVLLSDDIVFPVLYQVLSKRTDDHTIQLSYLKKLLDKYGKIE